MSDTCGECKREMSECWCFDYVTANDGEATVNDTETIQEQKDAELITAMRTRVENAKAQVAFITEGAAKPTDPETLFTDEARAFCAALRTIDRLEREIARLLQVQP